MSGMFSHAGDAEDGISLAQTLAIALNSTKQGITAQQAQDIATNNQKLGITTQERIDIGVNNSKVGITSGQTSAITTNQGSIVTLNTKTANIIGSSSNSGANAVLLGNAAANTIRVGDRGGGLANNRVGFANNAHFEGGGNFACEQADNGDLYLDGYKIDIGSQNLNLTTMNTSIASNTSTNTQQTTDINTNTTAITNIKDNTATSSLKTAVDANTAKTGITAQQASDITSNNSKVGITAQQASDITANKTELGNITIGSDTLTYKNLKVGVTGSGAQMMLGHNALGFADATCSMRVLNNGNLRLNVPTGGNYQFRINDVVQYNNTQIKNLVDNISVTQEVDLDAMESNIASNNAKVSTQWSNNGSEVYINQNVGIGTSNPNCALEIGDGTANVALRLGGQNGQLNSSEIIFADSISDGVNPDYYQGATIRFNSSANRLEIGTDQGNDNVPEGAIFVYRDANPYVDIFRLRVPTSFTLYNVDQAPKNSFLYGRRVKLLSAVGSATPNEINVPNSAVAVVWQSIITNGNVSYNTSTGVLSVSVTGLYRIKAKVSMNTSSAQRVAKLSLKKDGADFLIGKNHLSRHEANNDSFSSPEIDGIMRLASGSSYVFFIECLDDGDGNIKNGITENNSVSIEGLILPNGYTLPTDWGLV